MHGKTKKVQEDNLFHFCTRPYLEEKIKNVSIFSYLSY